MNFFKILVFVAFLFFLVICESSFFKYLNEITYTQTFISVMECRREASAKWNYSYLDKICGPVLNNLQKN